MVILQVPRTFRTSQTREMEGVIGHTAGFSLCCLISDAPSNAALLLIDFIYWEVLLQ